uniref:Branched-chain-amino-acid aminotransferase n=1 Tax=Trichobilharzia regenti TaxID=157069 RepID=A0AA85IR09_TRIRE|nr:unnamed protein product [Trichobilharzia regenti]
MLSARIALRFISTSFARVTDRLASNSIRNSSTFKYSDLITNTTTNRKPVPEKPSEFGSTFTDHMLIINWKKDSGWSPPEICECKEFPIHPGSKVLHYSIEAFEGMKAMLSKDGKLKMFRPDKHCNRLLDSTKALCLPEFDPGELLKCMKALLRIDQSWAPKGIGTALYMRPVIFGTEPSIQLDVSSEAKLIVMLSPVGEYYAGEKNGISLYADPEFVRSWPGGYGAYKVGSNYGPTLKVQNIAKEKGCENNLWLSGAEEYIAEAGTMNIFIYWTDESGRNILSTPRLSGLLLPGVTRLSILELARASDKLRVEERRISIKEVIKATEEKRMLGMFGTGTACFIMPINSILYRDKHYEIPNNSCERGLINWLKRRLTNIHVSCMNYYN